MKYRVNITPTGEEENDMTPDFMEKLNFECDEFFLIAHQQEQMTVRNQGIEVHTLVAIMAMDPLLRQAALITARMVQDGTIEWFMSKHNN